MTYMLVKHKVKDFAKWKPEFDQNSSMRKKNGCRGGQLFHESKDANSVIVLLEWDNIDIARRFSESDDLKQVMEKAGVIGRPEIFFLDKVEDVSA